MEPRPPSLFAAVLAFLFRGTLFVLGLWLLNQDGGELYGLALMLFISPYLLRGAWSVNTAARQSATQIELAAESEILSGAYGKAHLAGEQDEVVATLKSPKGLFLGMLDKIPLFYDPFAPGQAHMLTYAPARTGKSTCVVLPALLHWRGGSLLVTDPKGELTAITARHRQARLGQQVLILNPFGVLGLPSLPFNPLDVLVIDVAAHGGQELHDLANLIALQLVPELPEAGKDNKFFRGGSRRLLIALMLYLAVLEPRDCHLVRLRALVWSSAGEKQDLARRLRETSGLGGLLQEYGNSLHDMLDPQYSRTFGAFLDGAREAVALYDNSGDLAAAVKTSGFALSDLLDGRTTLYLILPEHKLETHGAWMGLITTLVFETLARSATARPLLLLLEEMGNLGRLPNLAKALSLLPGKGARCWMIFQSRQQPSILYGPQMAHLIEEQAGMIQAWAIRGIQDRREWSERIGLTTHKARSQAKNPDDPLSPWRLNINERGGPVMNPDEIGTMSPDEQLISLAGAPVIKARKIPYWRIEPWRSQAAANPYQSHGYPPGQGVVFRL